MKNMRIQKHSNEFKIEKIFSDKIRALRNKNGFQKVRDSSNMRLPNEENQTWRLIKTVRSVIKEDTWKKTPWLPKSDSDLNNLYIQKHLNDFTTEKSLTNKVRVLRNKKSIQKVRDLNNKRLPNEEKWFMDISLKERKMRTM